jgi:hypothetical protein
LSIKLSSASLLRLIACLQLTEYRDTPLIPAVAEPTAQPDRMIKNRGINLSIFALLFYGLALNEIIQNDTI